MHASVKTLQEQWYSRQILEQVDLVLCDPHLLKSDEKLGAFLNEVAAYWLPRTETEVVVHGVAPCDSPAGRNLADHGVLVTDVAFPQWVMDESGRQLDRPRGVYGIVVMVDPHDPDPFAIAHALLLREVEYPWRWGPVVVSSQETFVHLGPLADLLDQEKIPVDFYVAWARTMVSGKTVSSLDLLRSAHPVFQSLLERCKTKKPRLYPLQEYPYRYGLLDLPFLLYLCNSGQPTLNQLLLRTSGPLEERVRRAELETIRLYCPDLDVTQAEIDRLRTELVEIDQHSAHGLRTEQMRPSPMALMNNYYLRQQESPIPEDRRG